VAGVIKILRPCRCCNMDSQPNAVELWYLGLACIPAIWAAAATSEFCSAQLPLPLPHLLLLLLTRRALRRRLCWRHILEPFRVRHAFQRAEAIRPRVTCAVCVEAVLAAVLRLRVRPGAKASYGQVCIYWVSLFWPSRRHCRKTGATNVKDKPKMSCCEANGTLRMAL
jgi:hypothetical protein